MVRNEIRELLRMGPPPSEQDVIRSKQVGLVEEYQRLICLIEKPVTDEEAKALTRIFGADGFFGLSWTLVHLIETAPHWSAEECLENVGNEWIQMLKDREVRWRDAGYPARSFYKEAGLLDPRSSQDSKGEGLPMPRENYS